MFSTTLLPDSTVALLNSKPQNITIRQFKLLLYVTTAAKQSIAAVWKTYTLCIVVAKHRINQAMIHAKTEAIYLNKISKFETLWSPWINHHLLRGFDLTLIVT